MIAIVTIYVNLIKKGMKTIDDVPEKLREDVRTIIENMEGGD